MRTKDFDYYLPKELIAQKPVYPRDSSRLMVLNKDTGERKDEIFTNIVAYLRKGDVLVLNNTRVIPARLYGRRYDTGGKVEILLLHKKTSNTWETLVKPGKRAKPGMELIFGNGELRARVLSSTDNGGRIIEFSCCSDFDEILDKLGVMPLPPYIRQGLRDRDRYQTVYCREAGSSAAPTAGLHFTPELLAEIQSRGVKIATLLLHVGLGTFLPVKEANIKDHRMHSEYYSVHEEAANLINQCRLNGGRLVAVGTTTLRTIETVSNEMGEVVPGEGWTDIFIYPGYKFKAVDALLTNFHLPKSTLLMLVSAFAGPKNIKNAYEDAREKRYSFFSFGDAMLII
ncbi:MAG: tRNA preQ1(34) S-adenosylmethionine ribosyltransferase-isomerase QueA [Clostridia bacterium]|nr:tRNA preQ1(34) S-adenosylmethionine ribosyltransferase-isomerase QueA [Clostridia bacterium]